MNQITKGGTQTQQKTTSQMNRAARPQVFDTLSRWLAESISRVQPRQENLNRISNSTINQGVYYQFENKPFARAGNGFFACVG